MCRVVRHVRITACVSNRRHSCPPPALLALSPCHLARPPPPRLDRLRRSRLSGPRPPCLTRPRPAGSGCRSLAHPHPRRLAGPPPRPLTGPPPPPLAHLHRSSSFIRPAASTVRPVVRLSRRVRRSSRCSSRCSSCYLSVVLPVVRPDTWVPIPPGYSVWHKSTSRPHPSWKGVVAVFQVGWER